MPTLPITTVDVLILGGGTGGAAAGFQAARMGANVLIVEESPWLGGMITSAGASVFKGNKEAMGTGLFRMLREALENYYGGVAGMRTGWMGDQFFEPAVAAKLLAGFVEGAGAKVWHGAKLEGVRLEAGRVAGAVVRHQGQVHQVDAWITIDATEYGDGLVMADVPYMLGRDCKDDHGEPSAPAFQDGEVQDLTYCAILQRFSGDAPPVPRPGSYDPAMFDGAIKEHCSTPDERTLGHRLYDWESFVASSALQEGKFLLNWPYRGNDCPETPGVFGAPADRERAIAFAKWRTMCFVHFIQNDLGHSNWGFAIDEHGTADYLPFIPYIRESRRVRGVKVLTEEDVVPPRGCTRGLFQRDSIAVGDRAIDHRHGKAHARTGRRFEEHLPRNGPFMIPYRCLVPEWMDGLLVAEKNISVSHLVNGCTRFAPCVMMTGQAAGAAAALCVQRRCEPRDLPVPRLQEALLQDDITLYPTYDVHPGHPAFRAIQRLSLLGVCYDHDPMYFEPDRPIAPEDATKWLERWVDVTHRTLGDFTGFFKPGMTKGQLFQTLDKM